LKLDPTSVKQEQKIF